MRVKLLHNIEDIGNNVDPNAVMGLKVSKRRNRNWTPPKVVDGKLAECGQPEHKYFPMVAGSVHLVSDTTGQKWIDKGWAEKVEQEIPDDPETEAESSVPDHLKEIPPHAHVLAEQKGA